MEYVNTFTEFNRLSIKNKFSPLLRAWYLFRHYSSMYYGGRGWLNQDEAFNILEKLYKKNRVREIYQAGFENWWERSGDGINLFSVNRVANNLNQLPGYRVEIPCEAFSTLLHFKAYIYSTYFARESSFYCREKGKNISRKILKELFGISDTTQKRYEEIASIAVNMQYAYKKIPRYNPETNSCVRQYEAINRIKDDMEPTIWLQDIDGDGYQEIVQQISNNYKVDKVFYKSKENRRVKIVGGDDQRYVAKPMKKTRLYFENKKPLEKMLKKSNRTKPGYLLDKKLSRKKGVKLYRILN